MTCTRRRSVAAPPAQVMHGTSSDEALMERIADRDQLAMRALFGRHRTALYRWLVRLVGDAALAEDLLRTCFSTSGGRRPCSRGARRYPRGCWRSRATRHSRPDVAAPTPSWMTSSHRR